MKCGNCGCELLPDSAFCPQCGAGVNAAGQYGAESGMPYTAGDMPYGAQAPMGGVPKKRLKKLPLILAAVAGAAVIVVLVAAAVKLIGGSGNRDYQVAYYKNGKIYYTPNVKKDRDACVVSDVRFEDESENLVMGFSKDGEYLYFYSRVDYENGSALCRIPVSKIKQEEEENEEYIEEIDGRVDNLSVLEGNALVYKTNAGDLIYLNGDDETEIDSDVSYFDVQKDEQTISYSKTKDEEHFDLYLFDIESKDGERIGKDLANTDVVSKDFTLYQKNADGDRILYVNSFDGEEEKISAGVEDICSYDSKTKSVYYTVKRTESVSLYDCVDDTYADSDAGITEPDRRDFLSVTTEQNAVSEDDYEYYFEDGAEGRARFYSYLDFDSDMNMYSYYNDDYYYDDENYLFYYDDLHNQWYSYDIQGYEEAAERYSNLEGRIELRQELKERTYDQEVYDLYYYEQGSEPVLIVENIDRSVVCDAANRFSMYRKVQGSSVKIPIDDIYDADDLLDLLSDEDYEAYDDEDEEPSSAESADDIYYAVGTNEQKYKGSDCPTGVSFSEDGSKMVLSFSYSSGKLEMCSLDDGVLVEEKLSDNARTASTYKDGVGTGGWIGNVYYYFDDINDEDEGSALWKYEDGESEKIAGNVTVSSIEKDGNQIIFSDSSGGGDGFAEGVLELYTLKGDSIRISRKAQEYGEAYLAEDCILYISNESLYVYTGKDEDRRVDRSVTNYRCMGDMEAYIYY